MFPFITKTWNPIGGECRINCGYCWAKKLVKQKGGKLQEKYSGPAKLYINELSKKFSANQFVFVSDMRDLFEPNVPSEAIKPVLNFIRKSPAKFLLLTKNPERYLEFDIPGNCVAGATIETDLGFGRMERIIAMRKVLHPRMVCIEPIMNFSDAFASKIVSLKPEFVAIGYDNYNTGLVEPSLSKTKDLIAVLKDWDIQVYEKTLRNASVGVKK